MNYNKDAVTERWAEKKKKKKRKKEKRKEEILKSQDKQNDKFTFSSTQAMENSNGR